MTREELDLIERYFGPYKGMPEFEPAQRLVAHTRELQQYVLDLCEHMGSEPGPMKTAGHYQMQARAEELRQKIEPPRGLFKSSIRQG